MSPSWKRALTSAAAGWWAAPVVAGLVVGVAWFDAASLDRTAIVIDGDPLSLADSPPARTAARLSS